MRRDLKILLIIVIGLSFSKKPNCSGEQEHLTFGDYFSTSKDLSNYYTISVVFKIEEGDQCNVDLQVEDRQGLSIKIKPISTTAYVNKEKDYSARSYFFSISKSVADSGYKWRVKSDKENTPWHIFPTVEKSNFKSRFLIVADMATCTMSEPLYSRLQNKSSSEIDAFMHVGDFAYDVHGKKGKTGDMFFADMSSIITSRIPYIVTPGNHEIKDKGQFFSYRFKMPGGGDPLDRGSHWYSFDYKGVHWTSLNFDYLFDSALRPDKYREAFDWLQADLKAASQNPLVNFIIFFSHRPFYCQKLSSCDMFFQARPFEVLLRKYKVELIISGHAHQYMRLKRNTDFLLSEYREGPVMIINGIGGSLDDEIDTKSKGLKGPLVDFSYKEYAGYLILESTATSLKIEMHRATDDEVIDSYSIPRKRGLAEY